MLRSFVIAGIVIASAGVACAEGMRVEVRTAAGAIVAATDLIDGDIDAHAQGAVPMMTSSRKGDKRRYRAGGAEIAEVKMAADGFKVRGPDGKLRWKAKVHGDKVKLGNQEELGADAYELRAYADHVKLKQGEKELARVGVDLGKNTLKVEKDGTTTEYKVASPRVTAGFALLALPMGDVDRAILMSELIALGR